MNWRLLRFMLIGLMYSLILISTGLLAWRFTDPQKSGLENAFLPILLGVIMAACSVMSFWIHRDRLIGMIGIHVGMLMPLVAGIALIWRGWGMYPTDGLGPQVILLWIVGTFGFFIFAALLRTRPTKADRERAGANSSDTTHPKPSQDL